MVNNHNVVISKNLITFVGTTTTMALPVFAAHML